MKYPRRACVSLLLGIIASVCRAAEPSECFGAQIEAHVIEQFHIYGPLSRRREYFGFIYRIDGVIGSAVTRGIGCRWAGPCEVNTRRAAEKIPQGAKVLGEWHTHPHELGSLLLSDADVRGANDNRGIRCYRAFFSTSNGEVLSWDPRVVVVSIAMSTAVRLGNYRQPRGGSARLALNAP
jgi:hypothetical protein